MAHLEVGEVHGIVISSVVPPLIGPPRVCERYFSLNHCFIEPGVKTGMPVLYATPQKWARIACQRRRCCRKVRAPCIVVDFGTATTFDCVSAKAQYVGGVICPESEFSRLRCSRGRPLPRVDIRKPARVIGSNTVASLQSGLYYGYLGLVDGILENLLKEMGEKTKVIATGGLAPSSRFFFPDTPRPGISPQSTTCSPLEKACASSGSGTQRLAWSLENPRSAKACAGALTLHGRRDLDPWKTISITSRKSRSISSATAAPRCALDARLALIETWKDAASRSKPSCAALIPRSSTMPNAGADA